MKTLVALYDDVGDARRAADALAEKNVPRSRIRIEERDAAVLETHEVEKEKKKGGWLRSLLGLDVPREHDEVYARGLESGGGVVTVLVAPDEEDLAIMTLERFDPVDVDDRGRAGVGGAARPLTDAMDVAGEQRIPVVEEQLKLGKREVESGHVRVRSYVEEVPVSAQVELREESVNVERRPAAGDTVRDTAGVFEEKVIDIETRAEEPV